MKNPVDLKNVKTVEVLMSWAFHHSRQDLTYFKNLVFRQSQPTVLETLVCQKLTMDYLRGVVVGQRW